MLSLILLFGLLELLLEKEKKGKIERNNGMGSIVKLEERKKEERKKTLKYKTKERKKKENVKIKNLRNK